MNIQCDPLEWSYPGAPDTSKYIEIPEIPDGGSLFTPFDNPVQTIDRACVLPLKEACVFF